MAYKSRKTVYRLAREQLHLIKQSFEGQRFPILTNRSRVWPVNHLYHDKHTQTKHFKGNPPFLMNKRKNINSPAGKGELFVSRRHLFYKLPADLSNNDVELNLPDFNKSDVGC